MMFELNPIGAALPNTTSNNDTVGAAADLADNFDTFLTLLTEQLQNQDPLNPMDSQEFVGQLVQFSSVEQQISSNQALESLLALQSADARMSATEFVGRNVTVSTPNQALANGQASWSYSLPRGAETSELMITDERGAVVATLPGEIAAGSHSLTWDGRTNTGTTAPDGVYTLEVVARDSDGAAIEAGVRITARATGVEMIGDDVMVEIGALRVPAGNVIAVRESVS
jgi:flagellar basal-body rod modification protein FlgD